MRDCVFSEQAEGDLTAIGLFIAEDSPPRALNFVAELRQRCAELVEFPEAFRSREEFGRGIRVVPHGNYLIFYSVRGSAVLIEHIRHGARNLEGLQF